MNESIILTITDKDIKDYRRLDLFLTDKLTSLTRSQIKQMFEDDLITYHQNSPDFQKELILNKMPPVGTILEVLPRVDENLITPQDIPLNILYEDSHLLFIDKPAGMVVHPAPGNYTDTLVNALLYKYPEIKMVGHPSRPGIVHRLDKGTSGVMVVAKTCESYLELTKIFAIHAIERQYEAIILNKSFPLSGTLKGRIGRHPQNRQKMAIVKNGKEAITHYKVLEKKTKLARIEYTLETGRTHQIRVHTSTLLKSQILNDETYGQPKKQLEYLGKEFFSFFEKHPYTFLHAKLLALTHPITKEKLLFRSSLPKIFDDVFNLVQ